MILDRITPHRRLPFCLSPQRVTPLREATSVLFLFWLLCFPGWGQLGIPSSTPTASRAEIPQDTLGRSTPRGTVLGFLSAARKGDDALASQYLNTRLRGRAAADLAHQLSVVLDRRLPARLTQLSDQPDGSHSDPLKPQELVGTVSSDNGNVDITVEQVDRGKSGQLWLFSSKTLDATAGLYGEVNVVSVNDVLPEFLVKTRFAGIVLFQWLAVFVGMPLFYLFTALVNGLVSRLVGLLRRRLNRKPDLPNPEILPVPIRILLQALIIRWLLTKLGLPLLARQFWSSTATILTIAACVWLLILLNGWIEEYLAPHFRGRNLTGATSVLRLTRRVADVLTIFAGLLVALYHFGVNPTAALAGLGVGGIAVALAAQKTLENVIGGVSLIFDNVARVGDTLKVGDTLGTVEDIGLRSTRIRTLERTVVSVPNGHIANMTIENLAARDKFWFHPILSLRLGTTASQVQAVLDGVRSLLLEDQRVKSDSVRVRFLRFGVSSLEVEVFAYIAAGDSNEFLEIQEALLLRTMVCIEAAGVQIAIPSQAIFVTTDSTSTEERVKRVLDASASNTKTSEHAAAKSA
jgi:MscS family membrane protein